MRHWITAVLTGSLLLTFAVTDALAQATDSPAETTAPALDSGDTAWMLTSSALVLMMTIPGLALFYGGLVRAKNVLSTLMHSFFCAALISVTWVLFGYTLAFGPDIGGLIGGLDHLGMRGLIGQTNGTIPALVFVMFQGTFAIITPALISGTFAERLRFRAFVPFMLLWATLIYAPLCHWVWGGGWIAARLGALDFAGGTVVHISSGISALVMAMYLGKRLGHGHEPMTPHNLPFTVIGASLLWVGWFGFNAGSALASNQLAGLAFVNTNTGAAAAALGWMLAEWGRTGKPTMLGAASGAVAGLVCITPAAGFVTPLASVAIGAAGGALCYTAVSLKPRFGYDDALDVVGVHMVGGTTGALLTGIFATVAVNSAIPDLTHGLQGGGLPLLARQLVAVLATYAFCGIGTWGLLTAVNALSPLRAEPAEEIVGLDLSQHSERAYTAGSAESLAFVTEPRPAVVPADGTHRFAVTLEGASQSAVNDRWRSLCQNQKGGPPEDFRSIYPFFTTLRDATFRFHGGDQENVRRSLERLFKGVSPSMTARIQA